MVVHGNIMMHYCVYSDLFSSLKFHQWKFVLKLSHWVRSTCFTFSTVETKCLQYSHRRRERRMNLLFVDFSLSSPSLNIHFENDNTKYRCVMRFLDSPRLLLNIESHFMVEVNRVLLLAAFWPCKFSFALHS